MHVCVCSCMCVFLECASPCQHPGMVGGGACRVSVPLCSRTSCVPPERGSQAPPSLATTFPLRGPLLFPLGLSLASPLPTFPGAPQPSLALSLWLLDEAGGERVQGPACPRQDALLQGQETQSADPRQPGRQEGPGVPLTPPGRFPLWPSAQPGASPAQGCSGLSCCLPQQVSRHGPL